MEVGSSGERIYHRPADGLVPVWLEHLRSGWNQHFHLFLKHLCKYVYKLSPMQITSNGIKWMTWFLWCCNTFGVQPTLKLWHQSFALVKSSQQPLSEMRLWASECGYGSGLPFYNPRMSSSAYSEALRGFNTTFKKKKRFSVVESGLVPHPEEGSE